MSGHLVDHGTHVRHGVREPFVFVRTFLTNTLSREFLQTPPKHRKRPNLGKNTAPEQKHSCKAKLFRTCDFVSFAVDWSLRKVAVPAAVNAVQLRVGWTNRASLHG